MKRFVNRFTDTGKFVFLDEGDGSVSAVDHVHQATQFFRPQLLEGTEPFMVEVRVKLEGKVDVVTPG